MTESYEFDTERNAMGAMADHQADATSAVTWQGLPFGGQVAGRIDSIRPVAEVIQECADDCLG